MSHKSWSHNLPSAIDCSKKQKGDPCGKNKLKQQIIPNLNLCVINRERRSVTDHLCLLFLSFVELKWLLEILNKIIYSISYNIRTSFFCTKASWCCLKTFMITSRFQDRPSRDRTIFMDKHGREITAVIIWQTTKTQ